MIRWALVGMLLGSAGAASAADAIASRPIDTPVATLRPGQYIWDARVAPAGPVVIAVNLATQRAFVWRNGVRIGATTVTTGKRGKRTPTGLFTILQKKVDHRSNKYDDAPMPYMQRLTWDGVALHAGRIHGRAASHGCVRLPLAFARALYGVTNFHTSVVVYDAPVGAGSVAADGLLSPFAPDGQLRPGGDRFVADDQPWRWDDAAAATTTTAGNSAVSVMVSAASRRALVYRDGVEIGRAAFDLPAGASLRTRALRVQPAVAASPAADEAEAGMLPLALPGSTAEPRPTTLAGALNGATLPAEFLARLRPALTSGSVVVTTDARVLDAAAPVMSPDGPTPAPIAAEVVAAVDLANPADSPR